MLRRRVVLAALVAMLLLGSSTAWSAAGRDLPRRYVPALDGAPVSVELPHEGGAIAAWAYRSGSEYDMAVSVRDPLGSWDAPVLIGAGDRVDQVDPALALDSLGTVYLVFAVRPAGGLFLSIRRAGSVAWTPPAEVVPAETHAAAPGVRVVGGRLVIAFRAARATSIVDLPLLDDGAATHGIQDGPDGVDPLGASETPGAPLWGE